MDIDIVCSCDQAFLPHLAAMLLSLAETNPNNRFRIFILCDGALADIERLHEAIKTKQRFVHRDTNGGSFLG